MRMAGWRWAAALVTVVVSCTPGGAAEPATPMIERSFAIDGPALPAGRATVPFGGCSDLAIGTDTDDRLTLWTITDRGPNGTAQCGEEKRRTLLEPLFAPSMIALSLQDDGAKAIATADRVVTLTRADGRPADGRPNGVGADEPMLERDGKTELGRSPDGVDPEGLVPCDDGFWACEEYRPSLLRVSREGRILERHVPQGVRLADAGTTVIDDLPAAYGQRRDNRGFEALALSPDGTRLYALLQSPLEHPRKKAAVNTGNVRMLVADAVTGRPVAEHLYRLGDPTDEAFASHGAPPNDGKLCAMAALADGGLLVLEQGDGGLARVYRVSVAQATDTLGRSAEPLETIADLESAGIAPVGKQLVADLGSLLRRMRSDVYGDADHGGSLKLEGMAVLPGGRLALINDNDFGVHQDHGEPAARTCLWIVSLPDSTALAARPQ